MSIVQVARKAGVSTATVSRVMNDLPGVRDQTKHLVRVAANKLNYTSPAVKRGPKAGGNRKPRVARRAGIIVIVTVGSDNGWLNLPVMAAVVNGITRSASECGYKVLLETMESVDKPCSSVVNGEVDGAIVFLSSNVSASGVNEALAALQRHVSVVWVMGGDGGIAAVDHVIPDDRAIARLAFNYLVKAGCKELAFLTSSPTWTMMRNRGQAFASLAHDAGMRWSAFTVSNDVRDGDLFGRDVVVEPDLDSLVNRIAAASPRPDGIFIGNDATTAFIHPMLLRRGIIPDSDIKLVSCDNERVRLDGLVPRPLSIDIGSEEVGVAAVRRLCFRIENPTEPPMLIKVAPFCPI